MLMAMTISACGNQTPQADLAEMQENDTITADAEGQTEYEEAAAEKEGSSEDNSIVEVSNSENNIVEITDYIEILKRLLKSWIWNTTTKLRREVIIIVPTTLN